MVCAAIDGPTMRDGIPVRGISGSKVWAIGSVLNTIEFAFNATIWGVRPPDRIVGMIVDWNRSDGAALESTIEVRVSGGVTPDLPLAVPDNQRGFVVPLGVYVPVDVSMYGAFVVELREFRTITSGDGFPSLTVFVDYDDTMETTCLN